MKRLPKSEARLLKGAAAQAYAEFLMQEAQIEIDAQARLDARVREIRAEALLNAELEAAKLREAEVRINDVFGTVTLPTGETVPASQHARGVVNDGITQRFGVRVGDK